MSIELMVEVTYLEKSTGEVKKKIVKWLDGYASFEIESFFRQLSDSLVEELYQRYEI